MLAAAPRAAGQLWPFTAMRDGGQWYLRHGWQPFAQARWQPRTAKDSRRLVHGVSVHAAVLYPSPPPY